MAGPERDEAVKRNAAAVISRVTTHGFYDMQARLSPAFAEGEAWNLYLSGVRNILQALESSHELIPDSTPIIYAILYLCKGNPEKLSYIWRGSGQKYWRTLPPDLNDAIRQKQRSYSEKLLTLDPSKRAPAPLSRRTEEVLTRGQWVSLAVGLMIVLIFIAVLAVHQGNNEATTSQDIPTRKFSGTAEEKAYLEASGRYLNIHFQKCKSASVTMAGASDGSSTLSDIRTALQESRVKINESWENDFLPVSNGNVPQKFADVDKQLRSVHALQEDAFVELLRYWKDERLSHITNGTTMFKQALLECDSAIKDLSKILDSYKSRLLKSPSQPEFICRFGIGLRRTSVTD